MLRDSGYLCLAVHLATRRVSVHKIANEKRTDFDRGNLGPKTYLVFAGWMLFATITTYFCLPETKGRSPAELDEMFAAKVPARQFKSGFISMTYLHSTNLCARLSMRECQGEFFTR